MNIIIPLGGRGERFSKNGYLQPKPLIQIFDKSMIEYVLDNITVSDEDNIFIIYNKLLDEYDFYNFIRLKYPQIQLIKINDTIGAVQTLSLGLSEILQNYKYNNQCLIIDCDTFYTEDIVGIFRKTTDNMVFYTKNYNNEAIYSYIQLNDSKNIIKIKEKEKISDNANTGAYGFGDIEILNKYCNYILDNDIRANNEPYTSCVIAEMINDNIVFKSHELANEYVFSLGTPIKVQQYIDESHAWLFDLDGTLVLTDDIYFEVWTTILSQYNIALTMSIFKTTIQGNNDTYVVNTLLSNIDVSINDISIQKDQLFIQNINKIKIIDGIYDIFKQIIKMGHKICIVTNCNEMVAHAIVNHINISKFVDFIISNTICSRGKPDPEPYRNAISKYNINPNKCIILEDSLSGILSAVGVNPKLIVGIETIYSESELMILGVEKTIVNYSNLNINDILCNSKIYDNKPYLKTLIKKYYLMNNIKDVIIENDKLKGGFIADIVGYTIITNDNIRHSGVLKYEVATLNDLSIMAKKLDLYEREYYFYTNISKHININIPKWNTLLLDDNNKNIGICLENLLDKGFEGNIQLSNESIDTTLLIVSRMAKMHSIFWNKQIQQQFPKLKCSTDIIFRPFFKKFIGEHIKEFKSKWGVILNVYQLDKCDEIYNNFDNIQERFSVGHNLTFIHGDIKSPNIFYDVNNNCEPYFIDWQHCAVGKGVQDLVFFIIESFNMPNLAEIFIICKAYYYQKILDFGIINYTMDDYNKDIKDALYYIPFFTSIWFGTIPQDELIDKNFPFFFIKKLFYLIEFVG